MSGAWNSAAEDFGQKVDLTVRIREILRNYPEGLSILKELIQNADDAGARTVRFCTAEPRSVPHGNIDDKLSELMKGPSLLSFNSAKFTDTDFKSIQRIGDSLKKDKNGTKTGRFGVGVNSTYHLTDVPMFVSGSKIVMFDPQASFVPGINPANPGKMIDCAKANGRNLVQSLPHVFEPLKVFGCQLNGEEFDGTTFRFALRTEEQAEVSRLSRQSHSLKRTRELLRQMAAAGPAMLLFLKNVECIEIYDWKADMANPTLIARTALANTSDLIRSKRSYVLSAPSRVPSNPKVVDYILDIESSGIGTISNGGSSHASERWMVCNQLGGGNASLMARDPALSHMKLVPWAGVAARLSPACDAEGGNAYCFLPLPVRTKLPIHVNGYFELSSNRRDVWWGDDMAGDGKARADWNRSIIEDIAGPSYIRLIEAAIRTKLVKPETYELLFPQRPLSGPWRLLGDKFFSGIRDIPVLYSSCATDNHWVAPSKSILMHDEGDKILVDILSRDRLPLVLFTSSELKSFLLKQNTCTNTTTPDLLRRYYSRRKEVENGALEDTDNKLKHAEYLLNYCKSDLNPTQYSSLSGCQFIPLASGELGRFCTLPNFDHSSVQQLQSMGFSRLLCIHALRVSKDSVDNAMEWLLTHRYSDEASTVQYGIDPYLVCGKESASLLRTNAAHTFIDSEMVNDPALRKFFISGAVSSTLNILPLEADMLPDIVARAIPRSWRGKDSAPWDLSTEHPNLSWFTDLWRYICSCGDVRSSLKAVAEQFCIVPTKQGVVCTLSAGNSVLSSIGLDLSVVNCLVELGVRILCDNVLPTDLVVPKEIWTYIFEPTRDGVVRTIDAAARRQKDSSGRSILDKADDKVKDTLYQFFVNKENCSISTQNIATLRSFAIFRAYSNTENNDTTWVTMSKSGQWYVLDGASEEEKIFMTSDFLATSSTAEMNFMVLLGAKKMSRGEFFRRVVMPQLSQVKAEVGDKVIQNMLINLSSLCLNDARFGDYLSTAKFIRSSESQTLKSPSELYDPEVPQLLSLMDHDSFPDDFYLEPDLLLGLRKLGLQSTLSWDTVLECARSIEYEGTKDDPNLSKAAKARGEELLLFLDMHVDTFFPEFQKSQRSRTSKLFHKMNAALFEDSEHKQKAKELHARRIQELLNTKWMPVYNESPQLFLPWPEKCEYVAAPVDSTTVDKMWLASYSKRLVDGDVHSAHLKKLFGWLDDISVRDVSLQLRMLSNTFDSLQAQHDENQADMSNLCQKYSSEVGRIYHILNGVESEYEMDVIQSVLHGSAWLWMGDGFVSSDHVAYSSSINAHPYLFTIPPDLGCYRNLLSAFKIRDTFGSSDYCLVLNRMANETKGGQAHEWGAKQIELAVNLVQKISDDILRLNDLEIYAPTENGEMESVNNLVYDDAPWLSKDLPGKKGLTYIHPKLSASVCEKIGVKSVRKLLLQSNTDMISFGDGVVHEAFGQSESLTRRLKNIVEMYPEGPQQLNELIQNADDAKATVVKFVVSMKQYGTSSLLGQKMSEWQGGALYCYNDAKFTTRDFQNLAKIGQASKLEKLSTTGRFGLGFNSVFHWTDVPSIVSGDHLVMFDPHAKYVPGATDVSRGIKIRFTGTELADQFPDQMSTYCIFGNDMKKCFNGTLFRFPFRNATTASESEISKKQYNEDADISELIENFKKVISKVILFLRHVQRVEFYVEGGNDDQPRLQYYVDVRDRKVLTESSPRQSSVSGIDGLRNLANNAVFGIASQPRANGWNAISNFIAGNDSQSLSKEAFYSKLLRTPEDQLPRTKHLVTIRFVDRTSIPDSAYDGSNQKHEVLDKYLICSALGAGKCRAMACNPQHRDLKFLPWGSVAAHLSRNGVKNPSNEKGNAFCFLPLPSETGFTVHINGYFELSANRRDIWFGDDMTGAGQVRSEWNRSLLWDIISPLYAEVLLSARSLIGPGEHFDRLWPTEVSSDIWKVVRSRVFQLAESRSLVYTSLNGGNWVSMRDAVFLEKTDEVSGGSSVTKKKLLDILLQENLNVVNITSSVIRCMKNESCAIREVNASFVRAWFKKAIAHPSLDERENAVFLLRYCIEELVEGRHLRQLHGLPLLPLANGGLGTIEEPSDKPYFIANQTEKYLLEKGSHNIVDVWTSDSRLNGYLMNEDFHLNTNTRKLDPSNFVQILSSSFPREWDGLPEVHWVLDYETKKSIPSNPIWLSKLWDYIVSDALFSAEELSLFVGNLHIVPALVGEEDRTLQILTTNMNVVDLSNPHTGDVTNSEIARILRTIGIRTLDPSVFKGKDRSSIHRALSQYVQPSTATGIIKALSNSLLESESNIETVTRLAAKFKYVEDADRRLLRNFLRDSTQTELSDDEITILRALPIFETFAMGSTESFTHLTDRSCMSPACADRSHLDNRFVKASTRKEVEFYGLMGLSTMLPQDYYAEYIPSLLASNILSEQSRSKLVVKMLQDSLRLSDEEGGHEYIARLRDIKFVPNCRGELVRPSELYDPHETGLVYLVDESMLPAEEIRHGISLQSLRIMGMSRELSSEGILESARQIEYQAKNLSIMENVEDIDIQIVRKRAESLLNFLDDDETIKKFIPRIDEATTGVASVDEDMEEQVELSWSNENRSIVEQLLAIAWLPVERNEATTSDTVSPPRRNHQLSGIGISSPNMTRPKTDDWLCSSAMDILSVNTKSDTLSILFAWNQPPSITSVASQLVALSRYSELQSDEHTYRQTMSKVTSSIYEILDNHLDSAQLDEKEKVLEIIDCKPWIWVGDRFVTNAQVAFNAPDNARPYLYSVPDHMLCYDKLLKSCGVRDSFSGEDFLMLLSSLSDKLQGDPCDSKQLDLAIFVARNLSRVPTDEFNLLDKSQLYLPSRKGKMFQARDMTFDDAPWLSAIVKKTRHVFVHPDVGNEVARILGAKSLRDVLSANQNGMVKIPCPKYEALHQLLSHKSLNNWECNRVVLELLEIAEMKGTKQVSILLDHRAHGTMSLLHPCLAPAQGPALVICFHDVAMEVDEVVRLTSPAKYYSSTTGGEGGGGGSGFPRYGRGLCGAFTVTDCLQVLTGRSLLIFDPSGNYLIEDKADHSDRNSQSNNETIPVTRQNRNKEKSNARNYGLSHSFVEQFPDQFDPFLSISVGVEESLINGQSTAVGPYYRGTVFRLPLRAQDGPPSPICPNTFSEDDFDDLSSIFSEAIPKTMLFSYHLQGVSYDEWKPGEQFQETIINCRVSSSPLSRRNHLEEMADTKTWRKEKSKLGKIFKSSWVPRRSSHVIQLSSRKQGDEFDTIDTYAIHSILGPPRLREMACTDTLSPLKLVPTVSIATHLDRSCNSTSQTTDYIPPKGSIFVGFDTGIQTGLPFHINAPLFLHEWLGTVLLGPEDDKEFKLAFPGIRNIVIIDKYKAEKAVSLALYVWNRQALTSSINELIPAALEDIKEPIQSSWSMDARLFYKYWPYYSRIRPQFKDLFDGNLYKALSSPSMNIYLTENEGFQAIDKGCFSCPDYQLGDAADFFLRHMSLFTTPRLVIEDLTKFGIEGKLFTPSVARSLLKFDRHALELSGRPKQALAVLEYCLADLKDESSLDPSSAFVSRCKRELAGLAILPLADGSMGRIGSQIVVANAEQQSMVPMLNSTFLSHHAAEMLQPFFTKPGFQELLHLEKFGPKILAKNMKNILPSSWEGKDFVEWNPTPDGDNIIGQMVPSKLWIYRFWQEVCISDHDTVQMFQRWPLIPTKSGELANCGNARFILYLCPEARDRELHTSLHQRYQHAKDLALEKSRLDVRQQDAEANQRRTPAANIDETFWHMGEQVDVENEDESCDKGVNFVGTLGDDNSVSLSFVPDQSHSTSNDNTGSDNIATDESATNANNLAEREEEDEVSPQIIGYDPNCESFQEIYNILLSIKCPLLDLSFFEDEKVNGLLPVDRLGVSRSIMNTLNQCINYWSLGALQGSSRILWSAMKPDDFDSFLMFLSSHERNRLSLMMSDLSLMKHLPIFETIAGSHVSIEERDENFTLDASVETSSVVSYLPLSLQTKVLADKSQFKDLYEDLNVQTLNEATILQRFVLKEFANMPTTQKEAVIKSILEKWEILRLSDGLIDVLKETAFVKREQNDGFNDIVYVKPGQLYDPRNELLSTMFSKERNLFPAEEFSTVDGLNMLETVGLQTQVDKDTFLKCAWIVESEQDVQKATQLFEYFADHFGEFFDGGDFVRNLAEVRCVPAEMEGESVELYRFREIAAHKDRNLAFKVMPVMLSGCAPPQVMFSSLGIVSPPPISVVLRQIRELTESDASLDQWTYEHGTVEQVFSDLFSFLQDNYNDLSPRVKEALADRPLVPIGSVFVKSTRLFFRLAKDLAPFFYEVPRAFGAYDVLLRSLGVRDSPKSGDYAVSLKELNSEIGAAKLNANELNSVIEVISLVASDKSSDNSNSEIFAPNQSGKLTKIDNLMQNDRPWLVHCGRIDADLINLVHPKITKEICDELGIKCMGERVIETLDKSFELREVLISANQIGNIQRMLKTDEFANTLHSLVPRSQNTQFNVSQNFHIIEVEAIKTRFLVLGVNNRPVADITNRRLKEGPLCFIDGDRILLTQLPVGISTELAIATALVNKFSIQREHIAGLAAVLGSQNTQDIDQIKKKMSLFETQNNDELLRGEPGHPLVETDMELVEIKPLKAFKKNEIVAVRESNDSSRLIYGTICEMQDSSSMSRLRVCVGDGKEMTLLSSQVYSLKGGSRATEAPSVDYRPPEDTLGGIIQPSNVEESLLENAVGNENNELSQIRKDEVLRAVQDLLKSADLSLNDDAKKMMDSNLALKESLARRSAEIESMKDKRKLLSQRVMKGIDSFLCPITREPMEDPVICCDGHTYERTAIEMWLANNSRSPKTNQTLPSRELIPNHALRSSIEAIVEMKNDLRAYAGNNYED